MAPEIRQRETSQTSTPKPKSASQLVEIEDSSFSKIDIFRTFIFITLISCLASYFITGESFVWNVRSHVWRRPVISLKTWLVGQRLFTDEDLKAYDGSDNKKPILLAINGTVYDVTLGRKFYGPGGSYHFFAGKDASRAFISSCFDVDLTPDLRGLEEMFLPLDDPQIDSLFSSGELKILKQKERKEALKKVDMSLRVWTDFFAHSKKYVLVGKVKREEGWHNKGEPHPLCKSSSAKRKPRDRPQGK